MNKNFKVEDSIAIRFNDQYIDLHNFYIFQGFSVSIPKNEIIINWEKSKKWYNEEGYNFIELTFTNVQFFEMSNNFYIEHPIQLEEIGYKEHSDFDIDWLNYELSIEEDYHIIFRFQGDSFLRIYADNATFSVGEEKLKDI